MDRSVFGAEDDPGARDQGAVDDRLAGPEYAVVLSVEGDRPEIPLRGAEKNPAPALDDGRQDLLRYGSLPQKLAAGAQGVEDVGLVAGIDVGRAREGRFEKTVVRLEAPGLPSSRPHRCTR